MGSNPCSVTITKRDRVVDAEYINLLFVRVRRYTKTNTEM